MKYTIIFNSRIFCTYNNDEYNVRGKKVIPVKEYTSEDIKNLRKKMNMSQAYLAGFLGVSIKTLEAWEAGRNNPSKTVCRMINMIEMNESVLYDYPFIVDK